MFLLWLRQLPWCGDRTPASVPPPAEGRSSPTNTPVFTPSSFILPSFAWFYIFFSAGQVLLSALSWCSPCTSVSEGVLLMFPWERCTPRPPTPPPSCSPPPPTLAATHPAGWLCLPSLFTPWKVLPLVSFQDSPPREVYGSFQVMFFLGSMPRSGIARTYGSST